MIIPDLKGSKTQNWRKLQRKNTESEKKIKNL